MLTELNCVLDFIYKNLCKVNWTDAWKHADVDDGADCIYKNILKEKEEGKSKQKIKVNQ